jgi:taurine dioxygenase
VFAEIYGAFLRYEVLFFHGQAEVRPVGEEMLARRFGDVDVPLKALKSHDDVPNVAINETSGEHKAYVDFWHTDFAYEKGPALVSSLLSRLIPPVGGGSLWADMEAAYDELSADLEECLSGLPTWQCLAEDPGAVRLVRGKRRS